MSERITIHGQSDDLIEVEGAIREEFYASYGESDTLQIGDYILMVEYAGPGEWYIDIVEAPEGAQYRYATAGVGHDYSDVLELLDVDSDASAELNPDQDGETDE